MGAAKWSEAKQNNGFSYAMPRELAQQQLRVSLRLVGLLTVCSLIAGLTVLRAPTANTTLAVEARQQQQTPVMTFVADNAPRMAGSAAVHVGQIQ